MATQKILVVDDNIDFVKKLARWLESEGFQALTAYGGAEGLQKATEEHPDLVILDVSMRDVDGYDVLKKIKEREIPTRVIVLTGYAISIRDVIKFIKAGACDYLLKGDTSPVDLTDAVKRALAVETTMNLQVSDATPIVQQLIASAERLTKDKEKLETEKAILLKSENKVPFAMIGVRLLCLLAVIGLTIVLSWYVPVSKTWLFLLPVILFALLIVPLDRVKKISIKAPSTEGQMEIRD